MSAHEHELPMLAGIATFFHWWEELLNIVSGPVLLFGMAIALVDLLTDGKLTATSDALLFAWAISQALGIDVQLMGSAARARHAHGWARVGWVVLLVPLGYAAWQAGDVFAVQQSQHITEAAALAQLGISVTLWLGWRAALSVGLVILNGFTRYIAPAPVALEDERAKLERELTLEPLRQRLRAQQVGGFRALAQTALQGAGVASSAQTGADASAQFEPTESHHTATSGGAGVASAAQSDTSIGPDRPPTGPGSPMVAPGSNRTRQTATGAPNVTPLRTARPAPRRDRRTAARANARSGRKGTAEQRVRAILAQEPGVEFDELVKRAKVSRSTASKYVALVETERAAGAADGKVAQ